MEILFFIAHPLVNALWDAEYNETKHKLSWWIRGGSLLITATVLSLIFKAPFPELIENWYGNIPLYFMVGVSIEWLLFDNAFNFFKGEKWYYIGAEKDHQDDFTWKIYRDAGPIVILFLKFFMFMLSISIYTQLDLLL